VSTSDDRDGRARAAGVAPSGSARAEASRLPPIFTVGHSNRTLDTFADLLQAGSVVTVADIRSVPRSRANPQFNLESLPGELARRGIGHVAIPELGGLRPKSRTIPAEVNAFWTNASFHNYADHALTEEFGRGLSRLLELSSGRRCAVMCAEAVWWRCHRRIVADHLIVRGRSVFHLMGEDRIDPARLTPSARVDRGRLTYPADG
jgi:uncharacterized protein (DUF488 family)